jgi:hypothetical protein
MNPRDTTRKPLPDITDAEEAEIQRQIAADPDDEELSDEAAKHPMTFAQAHPELAATIDRTKIATPKGRVRRSREITDAEEAAIQRQIAADPDAPEATDEQIARAKPFREVFPELAASIERSKAAKEKGHR